MHTAFNRWVLVKIVLHAALAAATQPALAATVYFSDKDAARIYRVDPGAQARVLLDGANGLVDPRGVAVDVGAGKIYWADAGTRTIRRAGLDGSTPEDVVATGLLGPSDIELDLANGHLYWADRDSHQIARSNLDGSGVTVVRVGAGVFQPYYLSLDVAGGEVYWTDFDSGSVHAARLDGAGPVRDVVVGLVRTRDVIVAPDHTGGWLYWADRDARKIQRQRLDGTLPPEDLFTAADGLVRPHGLALDAADGLLYWTDTDGRRVARGNADGSGGAEIVAGQGLVGAWGITVVVPEPGAAAAFVPGAAALLVRRRARPIRPAGAGRG